jgi:diamine N-acetyltransferase
VERIYLHKAATGKGIGKKLMQLAQQKAQALKKEVVFLKAMDSSIDAIAFYTKPGYKICGTLQLPLPEFSLIKEGYRGMVILKKTVEQYAQAYTLHYAKKQYKKSFLAWI